MSSSPRSPLCGTHDDLRGGAAQFLAKGKEDSGATRNNYLPRKALPEKKLENV